MGTRGLSDNRVDHGVLFHLEIHQVIGAGTISHSDAAFPSDHCLSDAFTHSGRRRKRSAILFSPTLGTAR